MYFSHVVSQIAGGLLIFSLLLHSAQAQRRLPTPPDTPDEIFIQLRDAARNNDAAKASQLAARIPDYPIKSYWQYFQIKPRIYDNSGQARTDAPDADIVSFIKKYDGEALADRMRNDYLLVLGKRRDWAQFDVIYPQFVLKDDTQVTCYALTSRSFKPEVKPERKPDIKSEGDTKLDTKADSKPEAKVDSRLDTKPDTKTDNKVDNKADNKADNKPLLETAWPLLQDSKNLNGDGCALLAETLYKQGRLDKAAIWELIKLSYEANYLTAGKRLAQWVLDPIQDARLEADSDNFSNKTEAELAALNVAKLARTDPDKAAGKVETLKLPARSKATLWGLIGMNAAKKLQPEALSYYRKAGDAKLWDEALQWQVRAALLVGDWKTVRSATEKMSEDSRKDPTWTYWLARAYKHEGRKEDAHMLWHRIADQFNFYGQLASEELARPITLPVTPPPPTEAELADMAQIPGFTRAAKLYELNLRFEGNREWNWPLRGMSDRQLLAAAAYAKQLGLLDRTVNTADRTKEEHDFSLRYLSPYRDVVKRQSSAIGLDEAWAYGIMRQESRFITAARSGVGASGLMQVMPATGRWVARKIGLSGFDASQLNDININVQIGTNYLKMVSDDLQGSQTLASAAYNAGPGRPRQWRANLQRVIEGAIFAETIPFNETRGYVKNVLANATYYALLFGTNSTSLKERLGLIKPLAFEASDLP